jgi:hypothetical protein
VIHVSGDAASDDHALNPAISTNLRPGARFGPGSRFAQGRRLSHWRAYVAMAGKSQR